MKRTPESISLSDELTELMSVLESAEMLASLLENQGLPDADSVERAPRLLAAVIELAIGRVRLLRKVVTQQADVSLIVGRRNRRDSLQPGEDPDVLLPQRRRRHP